MYTLKPIGAFMKLFFVCENKEQACPQGLLCPPRNPWESCKQKEGRRPYMLMQSFYELADKLRGRCISKIQGREEQDG